MERLNKACGKVLDTWENVESLEEKKIKTYFTNQKRQPSGRLF